MTFTLLLALAFVLVALGGAIRFARDRALNAAGSTDQSRRILIPPFAFTLALTVYSVLAMLGWAAPSFLIGTAITVFVINGMGSLLLVAATDVAFKAMGARRTRAWLLAGISVFFGGVAVALLVSAGAFTGRGFTVLLTPDLAALVLLAIAAALIWWSFLPAEGPVATVFE